MREIGFVLLALLVAGCALPVTPVALATSTGTIRPAKVKLDFTARDISGVSVEGDAGVAGRPVGIDDPVRVASISKLVVALGVMRLVEQDKLDLDRDVSAYLGWQVRNPAFPDAPVTLRHLLSHRSGLRDNVDYIVPLDGDLSVVMANDKAWEPRYPPGAYFS
jgi:CubicO group peptidase (beta-lactamase class C family)